MPLILDIFSESWHLLLDAAPYMLFGILIGGLLKVFLSPAYVARHLGQGRYSSVFKAALFGVPLPLCSCGVLPAAAALKRQGANNGATTAFLISTPESGIDSISVSYALLDPIMTVARPLAAFISAIIAGSIENTINPPKPHLAMAGDLSCAVDGCCSGADCPPTEHARHHTFSEKIRAGLGYAFGELWGDLAGWFFLGLLLAGLISALVPDDLVTAYLGGGLAAMLMMLAFGMPLYICATASTPIAAAMILKGVSPGAALVFMLAGPATNMATLTVLIGLLGRRTTAVYLTCLGVTAVLAGLALDWVYAAYGISAKAAVGQAGELLPYPLQLAAALLILALSVRPIYTIIRRWFKKIRGGQAAAAVVKVAAGAKPG
ncbi:MAG: SO_0444 family Cu/Zn efflux transporter [Desulfurivibrionaceae bacterium]